MSGGRRLGAFFKDITKLNDRRKWEGHSFQKMHYFNVYFLMVPSKATYFPPQRKTQTTYMEAMLYHQLRRVFVYCLLCLFVFYSLNGEGKGGTIRIQTKTNKGDDQTVLNAQRFGVGREQHGRGSWGTMGPKGVWMADQLTFLYTALATGNQGQL